MDNLKNLTKTEHRNAERTAFMSRLIKKNITPEQYYVYIKNQAYVYSVLEHYADILGIFDGDMINLKRSVPLFEDCLDMEIKRQFANAPILPASKKYVDYIEEIQKDKDRLFAHIYVRHMGDLSGGQIIKKLIPGPTNLYEFEGDTEDLKNKIREKLHDGLVDEAKVCFTMVQNFLEELEQYFNGTDTGAVEATQ